MSYVLGEGYDGLMYNVRPLLYFLSNYWTSCSVNTDSMECEYLQVCFPFSFFDVGQLVRARHGAGTPRAAWGYQHVTTGVLNGMEEWCGVSAGISASIFSLCRAWGHDA